MTELHWTGDQLDPLLETRLTQAIQTWVGTRYHEGAQRPRGGVDCWRFVSAVADDMRQRPWITLPRIIADAAMHSPETARAALRWAMREHACSRVEGYGIRPGDVVVSGPKGGGPGHAMLAGADGRLWHVVQQAGVQPTGLTLHGLDFHTILRVQPDLWALPSPPD